MCSDILHKTQDMFDILYIYLKLMSRHSIHFIFKLMCKVQLLQIYFKLMNSFSSTPIDVVFDPDVCNKIFKSQLLN